MGCDTDVVLGYGRTPLTVRVPADSVILHPPRVAPPPIVTLADALAAPIGAPRLRGTVAPGSRVTIVISDATRDEPRGELILALLDEIGVEVRLTIAIANGTHAPGDLANLGIPPDLLHSPSVSIRNHDAHDPSPFVDVGVTPRGTRVRYPRWLLDQDLVIATGLIRPHYFTGFSAGAKSIFPGLAFNPDIRQNHLLKSDPTSRLGHLSSNACRNDLEDAVRLLPVRSFLLNGVTLSVRNQPDYNGIESGLTKSLRTAISGDVIEAHRVGCERHRPQCEVEADPAEIVITSDRLPLAGSLYQASKLLAPAGMLLRPGGVAILAAECPEGTGPLPVVNEGIYRIGIRHFFPVAHTIYLVSSLPESIVAQTYCRHAPSVETVLSRHEGRVLVLPHAGDVIPRLKPERARI